MVQRRLSTTAEGLARRSLPWVAHDAAAPHSATRLLLVSASPEPPGKALSPPYADVVRILHHASLSSRQVGQDTSLAERSCDSLAQWFSASLRSAPKAVEQDRPPVADAEMGSSVLDTSIQAHTFAACVIRERKESATEVRPEHSGPTSSLTAPTGRPPFKTSSSDAIPVAATGRTIFGAGVSAEGIFCARADSI
jgi:hypothetical protein